MDFRLVHLTLLLP